MTPPDAIADLLVRCEQLLKDGAFCVQLGDLTPRHMCSADCLVVEVKAADLAQLVAALRASTWQSIATAPKDGTRILIYQPSGQWKSKRPRRQEVIDTAYWHQPGNPEKAGFWCATTMYAHRPIYWMPLPPAPSSAPAEPEGT